MKTTFLLAILSLFASNAVAISRHDSRSMTCADLHDRMAREGEIVLRYPASQHNMMMYDRYVSSSAACVNRGTISKATVPTSDNPKCPVQRCVSTTGKGHNR